MKYKISNKEFKNKKEITIFCRELIKRNEDKVLEGEDLEFMIELAKHHKNNDKLKDYSYLKIETDKWGMNYCVWIYKEKKNNLFKDDLSWTSCISNMPFETEIKVDYTFKFGKYKGQSIYDINDRGYLEWLLSGDFLNRGDKILINQFYKWGYIPYNPMFFKNKKTIGR